MDTTSDPSSQEYRNIRVLVTIFEELDVYVIEACREVCHASMPRIAIIDGDLCTLEDSWQDFYNSKFRTVICYGSERGY